VISVVLKPNDHESIPCRLSHLLRAQDLPIDRDRPRSLQLLGRRHDTARFEPGEDGSVERIAVDPGQQHGQAPARGRPPAAQRVAADTERGQDLAGRISSPLADRLDRDRPGHDRGRAQREQARQGVPAAAPAPRVRHPREVSAQVRDISEIKRSQLRETVSNGRRYKGRPGSPWCSIGISTRMITQDVPALSLRPTVLPPITRHRLSPTPCREGGALPWAAGRTRVAIVDL
jgi:hypothetical protein